MSSAPPTPRKHNHRMNVTQIEDNNNKNYKFSDHQKARTFAQWYKHIIDSERQALSLYLSTDATLEWFGRTIKTKKKVAGFLKHDMQCSKHDFTTVESIEQITVRADTVQRKDDLNIASPLHSPELTGKGKRGPRRLLRSSCSSPEWAEGCKPDDESDTNKKKQKTDNESVTQRKNILKREFPEDQPEINNHGDCGEKRVKRQCVTVTPPILEVGQGDCMPSTSGTDSDKSHEALNAQLPKLAVECNGYIEFARTRNNRSVDAMKWDRKCKVQISYSEDPINVGEYIIWAIRYSDESKCRRNLLAAFEEAEKDS